jgi:DNA invertase Pin-like site-specific DNA recombinase
MGGNMASPSLFQPVLDASPRVALYARISTLNHNQDPEMQLRELRTFAAARGWTIVGEFVDRGISGSVESRPELNRLMADARKRRFDCIAVWRFDRFARSTRHLLTALEEFRSLGVQFVSYSENIDTTAALGAAVFTIVAAVGTLERDLIRERVCAGLRNAKAKGRKLGRPRVTVNVVEVERLRSEGLGLKKIAQRMGLGVGTIVRALDARKPPMTDLNFQSEMGTASGG